MRRHFAVLAALLVIVSIAGCVSLPNGSRLTDGPAARQAVESVIGGPLRVAPSVPMPTGISGQSFTYTGVRAGRAVTVVVFDNAPAARFLLGRETGRVTASDVRTVRSRNVVVLYSNPPGMQDIGEALQRKLARVH